LINPETNINEELLTIVSKLHAYIGCKARYYEITTFLVEQYIDKITKDDVPIQDEYEELQRLNTLYKKAYDGF
jgi:hypothetical protein